MQTARQYEGTAPSPLIFEPERVLLRSGRTFVRWLCVGTWCRAVTLEAQMIKRGFGSVVLFGYLMAGATVHAHNSTAAVYDPGKADTVKGTLSALKFANPLGPLRVAVRTADGPSPDWTFTADSASSLASAGNTKVGPNALKIAEELTVRFPPARNGSPLGGLRYSVRADGTTLGNR